MRCFLIIRKIIEGLRGLSLGNIFADRQEGKKEKKGNMIGQYEVLPNLEAIFSPIMFVLGIHHQGKSALEQQHSKENQ